MMRRKLLQIMNFTLIVLLQIRCSAAPTQPAITPEPSATPLSSQKLTMISVYDGMATYVEAVRAASNPNRTALFRQYVVDPYWENCAAGGEYIKVDKNAVETPITDLDYLTSSVRVLRESHVEQIVEKALHAAATVLSGPNTTVCISVAEPESTFVRDYMHGVSGFTAGAGKIWLEIYPEGAWLDWIPYAVAHEYHHSVWTDRQYSPLKTNDLVDYLVFEGRADSFARLLYPDVHAPWTEALTPEQETSQWQAIQQFLHARSPATQQKFMFGGLVGGNEVPRWTGYTIGFHIVQSYLQKHADAPIDEWTSLDAHDLLDESGYDPK